MTFGEYTKTARLAVRLTLRAFSRQIGTDPSNWSKIERGVIPPPQSDELLEKIESVLELDAVKRVELHDLASLARRELPADLDDQALLAKVPAFFRALKDREYTAEEMDHLIADVRKLHKPD